MARTRLDLRTLLLIGAAAIAGAAWAIYNRGLTTPPYDESELRPLVWVIFATPLGLFLGWFAARRTERWWAAFVSFCVYFFTPFLAQRYESCTIVSGGFSLTDCFAATAQAQQLSAAAGHRIYFDSVVVIQIAIALAIAAQRALSPASPEPDADAGATLPAAAGQQS